MKKLNATRQLAVMSMLAAIALILSNFTWYITYQLRISFNYIPNVIGSFLYGPLAGGILGAAVDIIGYFIKPMGPFFPGFTISAILANVIYGLFLYKNKSNQQSTVMLLIKIAIAQLLIMLFIDFGLNSIWMKMLYGTPAGTFYNTARLIKNLVEFPFKVGIIFAVLTLIQKIYIK